MFSIISILKDMNNKDWISTIFDGGFACPEEQRSRDQAIKGQATTVLPFRLFCCVQGSGIRCFS
jgi:hypothetical protein